MIIVDRYRVHNAVLGVMTYRHETDFGCNVRTFYTVEREWQNNESGTAIPNGMYELHLAEFATRGTCYGFVGPIPGEGDPVSEHDNSVGLWNVEGNKRYACLIHPGNWPSQFLGCMGLGLRPGADADEWGVATSRKAVQQFMADHEGHDVLKIELRGNF